MSDEQPGINIRGEKVAIRPRRRDLVDTYLRWFNDMAIARAEPPATSNNGGTPVIDAGAGDG